MSDRTRVSIVQEINSLMRARADHLRWYGGDRKFMERTGKRIRLLLDELDEKGTDEHEQQS